MLLFDCYAFLILPFYCFHPAPHQIPVCKHTFHNLILAHHIRTLFLAVVVACRRHRRCCCLFSHIITAKCRRLFNVCFINRARARAQTLFFSLFFLLVEPPAESKTVCKITSGDVEATAEATISRNIDGLCTTYELQKQLRELELKLMQELVNIKAMMAQQFNLDPNFQVPLPTQYLSSLVPIREPSPPTPLEPPSAPLPENNDPILFATDAAPPIQFEKQRVPVKTPELKALGPRKSNTLVRSRDSEIHSFNNTILKVGN